MPKALAPVPRVEFSRGRTRPGPARASRTRCATSATRTGPATRLPGPDRLQDRLQSAPSFTTSTCCPSTRSASRRCPSTPPARSTPPGSSATCPTARSTASTACSPGPMINAEYGKPVLVRFDQPPRGEPAGSRPAGLRLARLSFLTHLHNGHTAPESDGNPHYAMIAGPQAEGYAPGQWVDNLYLNWPAGGDDREKQCFFWFHDHVMDHTGANVYKGMVGLYPLYDPKDRMDMGDERYGLRLPGVRTNNPDGAFDVKYDIPLVFSTSGSTTGSPSTRTSTTAGLPGRRATRRRTRSGGARRSTSTCPTTASSATSHGQRRRLPGAGGQAAQVPAALPRRVGRAHLRVRPDVLDAGAEVGGVAGLRRRRARGPVPDPRRPAVHAVHADRDRRRPAAGPDRAGQLRAVAGQAARVHRRLQQVPGRVAHDQGRRHLPDQHHEDARRPDVDELVAVHPRPRLQDAGAQVRDRRRRRGQQPDPRDSCGTLPPLPATGRR